MKPGYKQTEVGVIPEDWEVKPLSGIICITHGFGFESHYFRNNGHYRLTTPGHFHESGGFRDVGEKQKFYIGPIPDGYLLKHGDLIVAMTEQADGLLGSAAFIPSDDIYLHNQRLGKVNPVSPEACTGFLYWVFNSKHYRAKVRETAAGTKVKHTSPGKLLEIEMALPPTLAEQEAIAGALSDADALIDSLDQLIAKKRLLKQGAMQDLLTGKKRLPGFEGEWEVKRLGDLATLWKGGVNPARNPDKQFVHFSLPAFDEGTVPVVELGASIGSNKFTVPDSSILVSKLNPRIPRIWAPKSIPLNSVCSTEFLVLVPNPGIDRGFLAAACASPAISGQLKLHAIGTTGSHQRIHPSQALAVEVSTPMNLLEQTAIAAILSDMDAGIAALEAKLAKACHVKQGMMQELLTGKTRLV